MHLIPHFSKWSALNLLALSLTLILLYVYGRHASPRSAADQAVSEAPYISINYCPEWTERGLCSPPQNSNNNDKKAYPKAHLTSPSLDGGHEVSDRHSEVVVAVDGDRHAINAPASREKTSERHTSGGLSILPIE